MYGRTPSTRSIVESMKKSGAICTMPPIEMTTKMPINKMSEWRSNHLWKDHMMPTPLFSSRQNAGRGNIQGAFKSWGVAARGAPQIVGHYQRA